MFSFTMLRVSQRCLLSTWNLKVEGWSEIKGKRPCCMWGWSIRNLPRHIRFVGNAAPNISPTEMWPFSSTQLIISFLKRKGRGSVSQGKAISLNISCENSLKQKVSWHSGFLKTLSVLHKVQLQLKVISFVHLINQVKNFDLAWSWREKNH